MSDRRNKVDLQMEKNLENILEKYYGKPNTVDTIQNIKYELEKAGYNISYISTSSSKHSNSIQGDIISHWDGKKWNIV